MGLMYSKETDRLVDRAEIASLPVPAAMGRFHHPYPFADYIDDVTCALDRMGLVVAEEEYAVTNDNNRMFGLMRLRWSDTGSAFGDSPDWAAIIGLRGSHDQRIPRGLVLGSHVFVCSNLCFHGNIANLTTKQTLNIVKRMPMLLEDTLMQLPGMVGMQHRVFDKWRNHAVSDNQAKETFIDLYRRGAFSSPQLTRAIDQFFEPDHEEHMAEGRTLWTLFNASTEALKPTGSSTNMHLIEDRTRVVSDHLSALVGENSFRPLGEAA